MASPDPSYEDLSAHYHLLFDDWDEALIRQGRVLDRLIGRILGPGPRRILDAACGIGICPVPAPRKRQGLRPRRPRQGPRPLDPF